MLYYDVPEDSMGVGESIQFALAMAQSEIDEVTAERDEARESDAESMAMYRRAAAKLTAVQEIVNKWAMADPSWGNYELWEELRTAMALGGTL